MVEEVTMAIGAAAFFTSAIGILFLVLDEYAEKRLAVSAFAQRRRAAHRKARNFLTEIFHHRLQ